MGRYLKTCLNQHYLILAIGVCVSFNANADLSFLAVPIAEIIRHATSGTSDPKKSTSKIYCVKSFVKEGDIETSVAGSTQKVIALYGESSSCKDPVRPIRADLEFDIRPPSANIELTSDFEALELSDLARYQGYLINAQLKSIQDSYLSIAYAKNNPPTDLAQRVSTAEKADSSGFKEGFYSTQEKIQINGVDAIRYEISGTKKGFFGKDVSIIFTAFERGDEVLIISGTCPTSDYPKFREAIINLANSVTWKK